MQQTGHARFGMAFFRPHNCGRLGNLRRTPFLAMNQPALSAFLWSVADLLRGDYKQSDYGKVILPFTVLRRLD